MLKVTVGRRDGSAPIVNRPLHPVGKQPSVRFAQRFVQILVGVISFGMGIKKSRGNQLDEIRYRDGRSSGSGGMSDEILN
jgi:hypothetical protein